MTLYLDTSSLIKLYVSEAGSDGVRQLVGEATVVATSRVAYAETRAALARLRRERELTASRFASAKREFQEQRPEGVRKRKAQNAKRQGGQNATFWAVVDSE